YFSKRGVLPRSDPPHEFVKEERNHSQYKVIDHLGMIGHNGQDRSQGKYDTTREVFLSTQKYKARKQKRYITYGDDLAHVTRAEKHKIIHLQNGSQSPSSSQRYVDLKALYATKGNEHAQ